jgi:PPK2 family polyphosphate:nucleotide phosphotransferase
MDRYRVSAAPTVDLSKWDTRDDGGMSQDEGRRAGKELTRRLEELQEIFYADGRHSLLVVLQAMDTGGKDGTIRRVFEGVNPVGVKVASFKRPTDVELAHDFLWRVHSRTPAKGEIVIFNRSHYEDVLVVRVKNLVEPERWSRRYQHISEFEQTLIDEGTTIRKFFLHISKEEQRQRLQERVDNPEKRWKFSSGDLDERKLWDDYQQAYADMLGRTSTERAPWYVVPADRKWYRDLVVATVLVETLESLSLTYPQPDTDLSGLIVH